MPSDPHIGKTPRASHSRAVWLVIIGGVGGLLLLIAAYSTGLLTGDRDRPSVVMVTLAVLPSATLTLTVTPSPLPTQTPFVIILTATPLPTDTPAPPTTAVPTATVTTPTTTPDHPAALETQYAALAGVVSVQRVRLSASDLRADLRVQPGYAHHAFAEVLFNAALRIMDDLTTFTAVVDDGQQVIEFQWDARREASARWELIVLRAPNTPTTQPDMSATAYTELLTRSAATVIPVFPTAAPAAMPVTGGGSRYTCNAVNDLNCSNFTSQAEAQAHLLTCGDEDRLDGDNNGAACESLP